MEVCKNYILTETHSTTCLRNDFNSFLMETGIEEKTLTFVDLVFVESGLLSSTLLSPTCVVEVLVVAHNNHDQLLSAGPSLAHQWSSRPRWSGGEAAIHQCTHPYIPTMPAHLSHSLPAAATMSATTTTTITTATPPPTSITHIYPPCLHT